MVNEKLDIKVIDLAETIKNAVEHIEERINETVLDNILYLFIDIFEGFSCIENRVIKDKKEDEIKSEADNIKRSFSIITESFEREKYNEIRTFFNFVFLPAF